MVGAGVQIRGKLGEASQVLQTVEEELNILAARARLSPQKEGVPLSSSEDSFREGAAMPDKSPVDFAQWLGDLARQVEEIRGCLADLTSILGQEDYRSDWPHIRNIVSQEEERARLAQALQNGAAQLLANAIVELDSCHYLLEADPGSVQAGLSALSTELQHGLDDLRRTINDLQPPSLLSGLGLAAALRQYLKDYQARTGLTVEAQIDGLTERLPTTMEIAIFRIIQEALQNAYKHAAAHSVTVSCHRQPDALVFVVTDNGTGFSETSLNKRGGRHLGLIGMQDRAELLGADLRIKTGQNVGTQVTLVVPWPVPPQTVR